MNTKLVSQSKFLSLLLRHQPETIGLELDAHGWASVPELLAKAAGHRGGLDRATLEEIVATNSKNRFEYDVAADRIRARQGHSLEVELELAPVEPPAELFHGTADRFLESILREGLQKRDRQHVHLSAEEATARSVGTRHGRPVLLIVASGRMAAAGHLFFLSSNGVWLTDQVPPEFLKVAGA